MRKRALGPLLGSWGALVLLTITGHAAAPNVRGKISGQDKLVPDVYAETAKPESRRWTWREPSPSVDAKFRNLAANPSRDICIAATRSDNGGPLDPIRMSITGGRVFPTTIVVTPGTQLVFKNFDPFKHRLYAVGQNTLSPDDQEANRERKWTAPGAGKYEIRDELFPSVRTFVIVDPQLAQIAYPGRDGTFAFSLPSGDYVLKAFFNGRQVGKNVSAVAKDKGVFDMKEPFNVGEDAK